MFVSDADVLLKVARILKKVDQTTGESLLPTSYWAGVVADAHQNAYNEILSRLAARGFSLAQILGWDRGPEFEKDLATWWTLVEAAGSLEADSKVPKELDRREELNTVEVTSFAVAVDPAGPAGTCRTGPLDTSTDHLVPLSPRDPNIGRPFRL